MAWDIYIQDLPEVASMKDIPADFKPGPIGLRADLEQRILQALPFAEQQDDWLFARTADVDLSIQFQMEDADRVRYAVVHVHGGEQSALCVAALLNALGLRGLDSATGEFFDGAALEEGL
jgi:hypothetical protein